MLFLAGLLTGVLAAGAAAAPQTPDLPIHLDVRVFDGPDEATAGVRVLVYPAGRRDTALADERSGRVRIAVPPGLYDVAVVREQDDRVLGLRWAERLVVMAYPDEAGAHVQVVNLQEGFGALQLRPDPSGSAHVPVSAVAYAAGSRDRPAGTPVAGDGYVLFVLRAGRYDISVDADGRDVWLTDVEVPLDRTRLTLVPGR